MEDYQKIIDMLEKEVQRSRLEIIKLKKELARVRDTHNKLKRTIERRKNAISQRGESQDAQGIFREC